MKSNMNFRAKNIGFQYFGSKNFHSFYMTLQTKMILYPQCTALHSMIFGEKLTHEMKDSSKTP